MIYYSEEKPEKCPECGSAKVAEILYGFPDVPTPEIRENLPRENWFSGDVCSARMDTMPGGSVWIAV